MCEFGDPEYDSDNDPELYDGSSCTCTRCDNFRVCMVWCKAPLCPGCRIDFGNKKLDVATAECPICYDTTECVTHPAGCGHHVCATCMRRLLAKRTDLPKPSDYGFVRTCDCEHGEAEWGTAECDECAVALEAWESTEAGQAWVDDCIAAEGMGLSCPVCRSTAFDANSCV